MSSKDLMIDKMESNRNYKELCKAFFICLLVVIIYGIIIN